MKFKYLATISIALCASMFAMAVPPAGEPGTQSETSSKMLIHNKTPELIGYLKTNIENQLIDDFLLKDFIRELEQGKLVNPVSKDARYREVNSYVNLRAQYAYSGVDEYIKRFEVGEIYIDLVEVLTWAKLQIIERDTTKVKRQEVEKQTGELDRKMVFHPIESGEFEGKMTCRGKTQLILGHVAQDLEMLSTQVNQWHWIKVMGHNPSVIRHDGPETVMFPLIVDLNVPMANWSLATRPLIYQVDRYLSSIQYSWPGIIETFISRLNKLSGIDSPLLYELIEDHRGGDQFRLPSESEWSSIVRDRAKSEKNNECGSSSKKFELWVVNGNQFEGFDNDVFELVGDDGWYQDSGQMMAAAFFAALDPKSARKPKSKYFAELESVPVGKLQFERHWLRRAWTIDQAVSLYGNCNLEYFSEGNPPSAFRLIRVRHRQ